MRSKNVFRDFIDLSQYKHLIYKHKFYSICCQFLWTSQPLVQPFLALTFCRNNLRLIVVPIALRLSDLKGTYEVCRNPAPDVYHASAHYSTLPYTWFASFTIHLMFRVHDYLSRNILPKCYVLSDHHNHVNYWIVLCNSHEPSLHQNDCHNFIAYNMQLSLTFV